MPFIKCCPLLKLFFFSSVMCLSNFLDKNLQQFLVVYWIIGSCLPHLACIAIHDLVLTCSFQLYLYGFFCFFPLKLGSSYFWEVLGFPIFLGLFSRTECIIERPIHKAMSNPPNWTHLFLFLIFAAFCLLLLCAFVTTTHFGLNDSNLCACFIPQICK